MNDSIIYTMTPKDLTNALKCLSGEEEIFCKDCAFSHYGAGFACKKNVAKVALYFFTRQKAEIERLRQRLEREAKVQWDLCGQIVDLKESNAEAIREFAERLKESCTYETTDNVNMPCVKVLYMADEMIDNLVKEMTEETS